MGPAAPVHPTDQTLRAYGLGKLEDALAESVSKHLESCPDCQRRVAEVSSDDFLGRLRGAQGAPEMPATNRSQVGDSNADRGPAVAIAPPPADTMPPGLADHPDYEVIRELGRGGMGVVYLVRNKLMGRLEVLKVVSGQLVDRPGVRDRFLREVESTAKLQHKNIVTAYSAMRIGESIVLSMEYVQGEDLAKEVKSGGPMPVLSACYFIYQAALGLQHAHERGMVHRDIKPANLILAREGKKAIVKVLDFGLAKMTSEGQADSGLTREGQVLGTPDYIAPEQICDAQSADIRADIYSLGCTLYYLLTGGPPFRGERLSDVYQAHFSMDAGPLNLVRPEVPVELAALVAKMMAKDPRRRFQTPGEVARELTRFFKPASAAVKGLNPEVSQVGQPTATQSAPRPVPVPARPTTATTPAPVSVARQPPPTQPGSILEGLVDLRETEPLFDKTLDGIPRAAVSKPSQRAHQVWSTAVATLSRLGLGRWWAAAGVLLFGFVVAWVVVFNLTKPTHELPKADGAKSIRTAKKDARPDAGPVAKTASSQESFENSIGMTLRLIPAGEFMMGSSEDDKDAGPEEKPQHKVRITKPFYLGVCEVTQAQYEAVMGNNPSYFSANGEFKDRVAGQSTDRYPVENVSWLDAIQFCNKLSQKEGKKPFCEIDGNDIRVPDWNGQGYRLPTEAEWEYSCRANTSTPTRYAFGNDAGELGEYAWFQGNSGGQTHPVGQKRPNAFGLFDMHGNVWEWCWDCFGEGYYKQSPTDDPTGPTGAGYRVARGGCWSLATNNARSADRLWFVPSCRRDRMGFRLAVNPSDEIKNLSGSRLASIVPSSPGQTERGEGGTSLATSPLAPSPYARWQHGPSADPAYFPIAVWLQDPPNAARYKQAGINLYVSLWRGPTEDQLATLKAAGMSVICQQNQVGLAHRDDPTIVGWIHDSETQAQDLLDPKTGQGGWVPIPPAQIVAEYERLRVADPTRPVMLDFGPKRSRDALKGPGPGDSLDDYPAYVRGADVVSFGVFPVAGLDRPDAADFLWYVANGVDRLVKWTGGNEPVWNWIECTHQQNPTAKATPAQVNSEVWMALVHGSRGLIYFVHQFQPRFNEWALLDDPEMLAAVTAINHQIRELAPVLNSPTIPDGGTVRSSNPEVPIDLMVKRRPEAMYVFAVGTRNRPARGSFTLRGLPAGATAQVLGEDRRLTIRDGQFDDDFSAYGVHIYRITAGGAGGSTPKAP